mmetsp:Transcript_4626/g.5675  ORF Transcript_4626/g.5675 Transcript_4626/m.5675 type:complete len:260 (-) Transcript_4626:579-1358(-)
MCGSSDVIFAAKCITTAGGTVLDLIAPVEESDFLSLSPLLAIMRRFCSASFMTSFIKCLLPSPIRVHDFPPRPARAVRPIRCTYVSTCDGISKLITASTLEISNPRAAKSVARRTSTEPSLNCSNAWSLCTWVKLPCSSAHLILQSPQIIIRRWASTLVSKNTITLVLKVLVKRLSNIASRLTPSFPERTRTNSCSRRLATSTPFVTASLPLFFALTCILTGLFKLSFTSSLTFVPIVAENRRVCLSTGHDLTISWTSS